MDELAERVSELERRVQGGAVQPGGASPNPDSEVSFGGDAPLRGHVPPKDVTQELAEFQARQTRSDTEVQGLREDLSKLRAIVEEAKVLSKKDGDATNNATKDLASQIQALKAAQESTKEVPPELAKMPSELDSISLKVTSLSGDVSSLFEGLAELDALQARGRLELLEKGLKALQADGPSQGKKVEELKERLERMEGQLERSLDRALDAGTEEMVERLAALEEKLASGALRSVPSSPAADGKVQVQELELLRKGLDETKESVKSIEARLKVALGSEEVEKKLGVLEKSFKEELSSFQKSLSSVQASVKKLEEEGEQRLEEADAQLETITEKVTTVQSGISTLKEQLKPEELKKQLQELRQQVEDIKKQEVTAEIKGMETQLKELRSKLTTSDGSLASLKVEVAKSLAKLSEERSSPSAAAAALSLAGPAGELDTRLRQKVQEQVAQLTVQLEEEMRLLVSHQEQLVSAKGSLEAAPAKASQAALEDVKQTVTKVTKRLDTLQEESLELRRALEELQGGSRPKVGISLLSAGGGSPLADVHGRLDLLSEQVAELQAAASGSKSDHQGVLRSSDEDVSLNFSLTEQTERPSGASHCPEGSLNYSLTEQSRDLSVSEPGPRSRAINLVSVGVAGNVRTGSLDSSEFDEEFPSTSLSPAGDKAKAGAGASSSASSGKGDSLDAALGARGTVKTETSSDTPTGGGRPRPSPLKIEPEDKSGSGLAPVAEESPDVASESQQRRAPLSKSSRSPPSGALSESPAGASGLSASAASVLEVSQSGNEVSIAGDFSVEDSLELEKCDHVEAVRLIGEAARRQQAEWDHVVSPQTTAKASPAQPASSSKPAGGDALDALLGPKKSPVSTSSPANISSPKPTMGVSSASSASASAADAVKAVAKAKVEPAKPPPPPADEDYGDESFEDNMSVPESIEEGSGDGSGSGDPWGKSEEV